MTYEKDYEVYFDKIGLTSQEERSCFLNYVQELLKISVEHLNNTNKAEVAL